jgi:DNA mismatch repair protein MLH3
MPVRVKQRAIEVERVGTFREFDQLIFNISGLLLSWPGEVAVSVQDTYARRTVSLSVSGGVDWGRGFTDTAPTVLSRVTTLLSQASIVDNEDLKSWVPIGATASGISVRGCVSLRPAATKRVQFIAIGIQPLPNEHHSNLFYEDVNRVFEDSSFGIIEEASLDPDGSLTKTQGFTGKELKPKRGIDRWPMFFLQIILTTGADSVNLDEFLDERHQNVAVISDLLQVMAYEFLKKHHFRPRSVAAVERLKRPKSNSPARPSQSLSASEPARDSPGPETQRSRSGKEHLRHTSLPSSRSRISEQRSASPFASWSRTKSNLQQDSGAKSRELQLSVAPLSYRARPLSDTTSRTENPLFDKSGALLRKPFDDGDDVLSQGENTSLGSPAPDARPRTHTQAGSARETVVWIDPNTKIKSSIDPHTGCAVKPQSSARVRLTPHAERYQGPKDGSRQHQWKPTVSGERNTIFQATEPRIPQVLQASDTLCCEHGGGNSELQKAVEPSDGNLLAILEGRISKEALQKAEIVAQVDRKFILAKVAAERPASSTSQLGQDDRLLILIDQHAADERCKVESLLASYLGPDSADARQLVAQTQILERPLRFDLSRQDGELLTRFRRHFAHWGITYEVFPSQGPGPQKGVTVEAQGLPPSILERCRLEPRLLIDLLRKEIWKLHGAGSCGTMSSPRVGKDDGWVSRFHDCPEGILELINSRACRSEQSIPLTDEASKLTYPGAVMFNDPLTREQCSDLVQRLAACAFPFQCAHGRPSMAPLVHLGQESRLGGRAMEPGDEASGDLLGELKRWKGRLGASK